MARTPGTGHSNRATGKESFAVQIDEWVRESKERLEAVARMSIQDTVNDAQTAAKQGGKMPVDTGFLRASGASSLTGMPYGPDKRLSNVPGSYPSPAEYHTDPKVSVDLANLKLGDTFYFGWTAEYARVREFYDGFLGSAMQNWQQVVSRRAEELRKRSGK